MIDLAAIIRNLPEWHLDALCREYPAVEFFPNPRDRESSKPALAVCARCSVQADCLSWALEHNELGVWGGTTETERKALRRKAS